MNEKKWEPHDEMCESCGGTVEVTIKYTFNARRDGEKCGEIRKVTNKTWCNGKRTAACLAAEVDE